MRDTATYTADASRLPLPTLLMPELQSQSLCRPRRRSLRPSHPSRQKCGRVVWPKASASRTASTTTAATWASVAAGAATTVRASAAAAARASATYVAAKFVLALVGGFAGVTERVESRDRPVEFEKDAEEADLFGLDQSLAEVKKGKKAKIGGGGTTKEIIIYA